MVDMTSYFEDKSETFHGFALMLCSDGEQAREFPYHIVVSEALSLSDKMFTFYGYEGVPFFWDTFKAFTSDDNETIGDILHPVYDYIEQSTGAHVRRLPAHAMNTPLLPADHVRYMYEVEPWSEVLEARNSKVREAHKWLEEGDENLVAESMYYSDVLSFQLWLMRYSEYVDTAQQTFAPLTDEERTHPYEFVYSTGRVFYDIMWRAASETLLNAWEDNSESLQSRLDFWRSRLIWLAGPDNADFVLEFFNNTIPDQ